ncbi:hypothetical protein C8R46DRAFT_1353923 [Mycena filopes]|nr:hypothetical protein C8R46DRAFT_1353923 [Mycena filopes]
MYKFTGDNLELWLGLILAGSWINLVFYTTEVILFVYHLPRWTLNPIYTYGSYALLANDAVGTFAVCANAFVSAVDGAARPVWPSRVLLMSTVLSAFMEQSFLIYRYYTVAIGKVMSVFLVLLALAHLAFTVIAVRFGDLGSRPLFDGKIAAIGAALCSAIDVLIALSICWSLSGIQPIWRSTQQLLRALCLNALASGAVVAAVTLLSSASSFVNGPKATVFTLFYASNGRIYSLTILVNIIIRNVQRDVENSVHVSQFNGDSVAPSRNYNPTTQPLAEASTGTDSSSHHGHDHSLGALSVSKSKSTLSMTMANDAALSAISLPATRARTSYAPPQSPR